MLVLSRKLNQTIRIGDEVCITVVSLEPGAVKLGIQAPPHVPVHRGEVYERIQIENQQAARPVSVDLAGIARFLRRHVSNRPGPEEKRSRAPHE